MNMSMELMEKYLTDIVKDIKHVRVSSIRHFTLKEEPDVLVTNVSAVGLVNGNSTVQMDFNFRTKENSV